MLTKMTGGGTVTIGVIQYDDLLLNNAHSNVTLDHGVIKMNPVTADIYNGKENGAITIDMRPAQPVYTVNLKTDKVDANKLISSVSDVKQTHLWHAGLERECQLQFVFVQQHRAQPEWQHGHQPYQWQADEP